jgi:hypothetical protein
MRLAGHEKHPQPVAHAVDLDDRRIVAVGQLALGRRHDELDHVHAAVRQRDRQLQILAHRHEEFLRLAPVDGDPERRVTRLAARHGALVLDPERERHGFADDGEGRRVLHDQAAVPVVLAPREQRMERRGQVGRALDVVQLSVGHEDRPREPGARFLGHCLGQRRHQERAGVALSVAHSDDAKLGIGKRRDLGLDPGDRLGRLRRAVRNALARALVDHHDHDVGQWLAVLGLERGVRERGKERHEREAAEPPAREAAPEGEGDEEERDRRRAPEERHGDERIEDDGVAHLLPQPVEKGRHMHLVGLVVAGQHMHHEVHAEAERDLALAFAGEAAAHREHPVPAFVHRPGRRPVVPADDHRASRCR